MSGPEGPLRWFDGDALHLDVRGLPPPQPLVAILRLLREQGAAELIVHLDRDPVMLYPELAEIGWSAEPVPAEPGSVVLRLARSP
jgi:hypothetical protein